MVSAYLYAIMPVKEKVLGIMKKAFFRNQFCEWLILCQIVSNSML